MEPVSTLYFGPFILDVTDDSLWFNRERCKLTAKAGAVLRYLVAHPGRLVRKADLLAAVWPELHVSDWVLTTCIREIRQVLGDVARSPQYIATVHRQGYRFIAPVTVVSAPPPTTCTTLPAVEAVPEAEHKLVTILSGALTGAHAPAAELGSERWYRLLQTVLELTRDVLQHYGDNLTLSTAIDLYRAMQMTFWLPQTEAALAQIGEAARAV
jgi:DNA-binding winged helix-turn-helix (wHTH) protein